MNKGEKKFLFLKVFLKGTVEQLVNVPLAVLYYKICLKRKDTYNLLICPHIGDFLYTVGYAKSFIEEKEIEKLQIVGNAKFQELMKFYPDLKCDYQVISDGWMQVLLKANRYESGQKLFRSWSDNCIVEPANGFVLSFDYARRFPELNLKECIRYGSLGLTPDSYFVKPLPSARKSEKQFQDKKKVLICPMAQVTQGKEVMICLKKVIHQLSESGYEIYVNGRVKELEDMCAYTVEWNLEEFYLRCEDMHSVIGLRSGIMDLAAFTSCRVIALYPSDSVMMDFYDIKKMNPEKTDVFQYILTGNISYDTQTIIQMNEENDDEC